MTVKVDFSINTVELEVKYKSFECGGNLFAYVSNPIQFRH